MSAQRRVLIGGVLVFALALFAVLFLLPHAAEDSLTISADAARAPALAELLPAAESRLPAPMGDGTVGPLAEPEALVAEFDLLAFSERGAAVSEASVQSPAMHVLRLDCAIPIALAKSLCSGAPAGSRIASGTPGWDAQEHASRSACNDGW